MALPLLLTACERSLIYFPVTASEAELTEAARRVGLTAWTDATGRRIGWTTSGSAAGVGGTALVLFHGNAGHALHRAHYVEALARPWPAADVYLLEYPGYGSRPGSPSEHALGEAAETAVRSLAETYDAIYLIGESLGSGVAGYVTARMPDQVDGLLLVTPFTSLVDVARRHYPGWLVSLLLRERYDNVEALQDYRGPLAVLLAENDEVVPAELGQRLLDRHDGPSRRWLRAGGTHNSALPEPGDPFWPQVVAFLQQGGNQGSS